MANPNFKMENKLNILVVGFGMMGCRHVQALLQNKEKFKVHVLEPSAENVETNAARIGAKPEDCSWYNSLGEVPPVELAIVATSSAPRFNIVKTLIESGCKFFLLEKIVFQSVDQFKEIMELMNANGVKAYCNFVNRYFEAYNEIKQELNADTHLEMLVYGNAFGLGCNAIHYIDIFQYLTANNNLIIDSSSVSKIEIENRRGTQYREFTGTLKMKNDKGDKVTIIADPEFLGGVTINIRQGNKEYLLSEQSQKYYSIGVGSNDKKDFTITPTSRLSDKITLEILEGNCRLTRLEETFQSHQLLFEVFNNCLFGEHLNVTLCSIT
jgi:predicted dehydrogenase